MAAFAPGVRMSLFVAFFLPVLLLLGNWQLDRAAYKRSLQAEQSQRSGQLPETPGAEVLTTAVNNDFRRVRIQGRFLADRYFLVDNQVAAGIPGYWVISPFVDAQQRLWLVNRGWLAAPPVRSELPPVSIPPGEVQIVGSMRPFTGLVPLLRENAWADPGTIGTALRVQRLDIAAMSAEVGSRYPALQAVPLELRLEPGSPGVLQAAPQGIVGGADRHSGYAVTWFGLALTLVLGFAVYGRRRAVSNLASTELKPQNES